MIDLSKLKKGQPLLICKNVGDMRIGDKVLFSHAEKERIWCVKPNGKSIFMYPEQLDYCDPQPADTSFKIGKYKHKIHGVVDVIAVHNDLAWLGGHTVCPLSSLTPLGKFDHLRGLPVDTKVLVWNGKTKYNRHFSHVIDGSNVVYCFPDGKTSFTTPLHEVCEAWNNCEVWEGANNNSSKVGGQDVHKT